VQASTAESNGEVEGPHRSARWHRGRTLSSGARGAQPQARHGPLQRWLDAAGKLPATAFEFDQESMRLGTPYIFN
jgi:hypothetical protein